MLSPSLYLHSPFVLSLSKHNTQLMLSPSKHERTAGIGRASRATIIRSLPFDYAQGERLQFPTSLSCPFVLSLSKHASPIRKVKP